MGNQGEPSPHGFVELNEIELEKLADALIDSNAGATATAAAALLVKGLTGSAVAAGVAERAAAKTFGKWVADNPAARLKAAAQAFAKANRKAAALREFAAVMQPLVARGLRSVEVSLAHIERGQKQADSAESARFDDLEELIGQSLRSSALLVDSQSEPKVLLERLLSRSESQGASGGPRPCGARPGESRESPKVFISSTYLDNVERRTLVEGAVLAAKMHPVGMERFTASPHPTVAECQRFAKESDIYVGIVARRYGWIPDGQTVSITELEYDAAKSAGRACYVFLLSEDVPVHATGDFDEGPDRWDKQKQLDAFKAKCALDQMPSRFTDTTLQTKVLTALYNWRDEHEPTVEAPSAPEPAAPLVDRDDLDRYKRTADAAHDSLPIAGFATPLRVKLDLEELYVPLHATLDLSGMGDAAFADASDAEERLAGHSHELSLVHAFREAQQRKQRGLVILGDPGSGKTTHLKRVLLYCLRKRAHELGLAEDLVPVFLPLRELRDRSLGLDGFIEQQLDGPHRELAVGFGKRLLKRGRLLLLFDGLDEVAAAQERKEVARWIEQAVHARPDCLVVVTCRFAGYGGAARLGADFLELHLRPLSRDQSEAFIHNWYRIVETALDPTLGQVHAQQKADELIGRLREPDYRSARLVTMTRNPLLLANLCLVHRDRGKLPSGRARLYSECIDVLLEHWRQGKGLSVEVTAEAGRRALQPAALWMHEETGRLRASAAQLVPVLKPSLAAIQYQGGGAQEFLSTVRDASGLLTGRDQSQYGFMHLGFQEYLAARELRRRILEGDADALKLLADGYGRSWWQEVILVLVALGDPSAFVPLMRAVVQREAFTRESELLDLIFEDAAEISALPFEELLQQEPGEDRALWSRQLVALQLLARRFEPNFESAAARLAHHPFAELRAWLAQREASQMHASGGSQVIVTENGRVALVLIPGDTFMMGSPEAEENQEPDERPQHEVTVLSFYLGRYPVTNEEYARFLKANPDAAEPKFWSDRSLNQARQPVVGVSWDEASCFARWAGGRLPTEAEWEYACRAGTQGSRYGELPDIAWCEENSKGKMHPVGDKQGNALGLHDTLGNVWEWCSDLNGTYGAGHVTDSRGRLEHPERVLRGGSWHDRAWFSRSAQRLSHRPGERGYDSFGFRLARDREQGHEEPEPVGRVPEPTAEPSSRFSALSRHKQL